MKRFKSKKKGSSQNIFVLLFLFIAGIIFYKNGYPQIKSFINSPKTETKKQTIYFPSAPVRVPILLYHYVEYVQDEKDTIRESLNINPNTFEKQVKLLKEEGFTFMTARELGDVLDGKMQLPKKPILLTFDDGHWDTETVILPILKKYNAKATAYIITGFIGRSDFMTEKQLQNVIGSGLVDVGAHTVHHYMLKNESLTTVKNEIEQSKLMLENMFHIPVVSFAYPGGTFDQQAINIVKNAGYTTAMSTIPGVAQSQKNKFSLERIRPGYRTGNELLRYLQQTKFKPY